MANLLDSRYQVWVYLLVHLMILVLRSVVRIVCYKRLIEIPIFVPKVKKFNLALESWHPSHGVKVSSKVCLCLSTRQQ